MHKEPDRQNELPCMALPQLSQTIYRVAPTYTAVVLTSARDVIRRDQPPVPAIFLDDGGGTPGLCCRSGAQTCECKCRHAPRASSTIYVKRFSPVKILGNAHAGHTQAEKPKKRDNSARKQPHLLLASPFNPVQKTFVFNITFPAILWFSRQLQAIGW